MILGDAGRWSITSEELGDFELDTWMIRDNEIIYSNSINVDVDYDLTYS